MTKLKNKRLLKWILIILVLAYLIGRLVVGGWLMLLYWYLIIIPPIWHLIIHFKFLNKLELIEIAYLKYIYLSHFIFLILILSQFDFGDGLYFVLIIEMIGLFVKDFNRIINNSIDISVWRNLQLVLGIIFIGFESFLTMKFIYLKNELKK